ncbi:hypothetical protein CQW23_29647 [Capsicum baccatum]|uniref:Uncharacterized protein n=1 Tax=Capsicum baccatum TaxID=33114 RepID=A0A2G2VCN0_CAPBA|nr:hypothetical protein CQW23_29647 [Capsicum baccatum]
MNHVPRSKIILQKLGNRITNNETQEQFLKTVIDIPLHLRSGRNVNRQEVAQEQTLDITLPQSSGSNVEQPTIVEENVQDNVEDPVIVQKDIKGVQNLVSNVADPVVTSRHSGRMIRKPLRFALLGESYDRIPEDLNTEPLNYDEALHDKDAKMWISATKSEMESLYSNQVWKLVEPPTGVKPIAC